MATQSVRLRQPYASPEHGTGSAGDVITLPEAHARELIAAGYADTVHETAALVPGRETRGRPSRARGGRRPAAPIAVVDVDDADPDDDDDEDDGATDGDDEDEEA